VLYSRYKRAAAIFTTVQLVHITNLHVITVVKCHLLTLHYTVIVTCNNIIPLHIPLWRYAEF